MNVLYPLRHCLTDTVVLRQTFVLTSTYHNWSIQRSISVCSEGVVSLIDLILFHQRLHSSVTWLRTYTDRCKRYKNSQYGVRETSTTYLQICIDDSLRQSIVSIFKEVRDETNRKFKFFATGPRVKFVFDTSEWIETHFLANNKEIPELNVLVIVHVEAFLCACVQFKNSRSALPKSNTNKIIPDAVKIETVRNNRLEMQWNRSKLHVNSLK